MLNKWRNYTLKDGKVKSSYQREYCNRKKVRKTGEASSGNSHEQSRKIQTKEEVVYESVREEKPLEAHQEGYEGIQKPDQGRCAAEETSPKVKAGEKKVKVKEKEKMTAKEKRHESRETKSQERLEDKREAKQERKKKSK